MPRNWKFHAIALTVICSVIVVLYVIINPNKPPPDPNAVTGDRYIQIYTATWGENCNSYIDQENAQRQQLRYSPEGKTMDPEALKLLPRISADNVLITLGNLCNGKLSCTFPSTSDAMKTEPLGSCYKKLDIGYRCFAVDRLWTASVNQGEIVTIDCHENATAPAPAH